MNYMQETDAWVTAVLIGAEDGESEEQWLARVKKQVKDKVLESYRNGQRDCPRCNPKPHPQPRVDKSSPRRRVKTQHAEENHN